ncbi:MAG: PQQ-binding-like beta-propeller repeat protein [Candidatus Bathyarchaeia archaeon]|jgi:hypothetical protein
MKKNIPKISVFAIAFVLMISCISMLMTTSVKAATTYTNLQEGGSMPGTLQSGVTADVEVDTRAFLSFTPNPIGVNQELLVNIWLNPALHVSRYFKDYTVTFTKPDGTTDVVKIDSYRADCTAWFPYKVDQTGTWTIKFDFPGGYFPAGNYTTYSGAVMGSGVTNFKESVYYKPSSTPVQNLTVQTDMAYSWPPAALPTDYWARPISPENREWWPIAGSYPATGYVGGGTMWDQLYPDTNPHWSDRYTFTPWVQAPNSAHIVWKRLDAIDGLVGGPGGISSLLTTPASPSVVYAGRCYQTMTVPINGVPTSCAVCYDLRTGQQYYAIPTSQGGITPTIVSYTSTYSTLSGQPAVPGATAGSGTAPELMTISNGYLLKINPLTGAILTNISISPLTGTGGTYYMNEYVLAIQNIGNNTSPNYRLINWTTAGTTSNFTARIMSNTSYARSSLPTITDYNVGIGATVSSVTPATSTGVQTQMTIIAYKLSTGEQLWNKTVDESQYASSAIVADHGKLAVLTEKGYFLAYDLATGTQVWQSEQMSYPWSASGFGAYTIQSAYGLIFREAYDGVYAYNWTDGKIAWKYKASATPFETPYIDENGEPVYAFSWNGGGSSGTIIADGKIFTFNCEHSPTLPITRGWKMHCINITTGEGIWNITGYMSAGAVADGYLTVGDAYDGYLYVFGKGQSATTISAPQTAITKGQSVILSGTILDQSPAQQGTPCVSKDSMATYMEYLHMQKPIDGLYHNITVTGVPISIDAIDPNGNAVHIADVTSDMSGTFSYTWTPEMAGDYAITATFMGDDSYGSSWAETHATVVNAPEATATSSPISFDSINNTLMTTAIGIGAAIILAIVLATVILIKKRA